MNANGRSTIHRRGFLGTLVAAGAVGVTSLAPFRLNAMQEKMMNNAGSSGFEDWLNKIRGKHRQVFDVPQHVAGLPLAQTRVFLMTNKAVGAPDDDVQAVVVLRHEAIPLAMDSALWKKYNFSKVFNVVDGQTKKPITQNIFWQPKEGTLMLPGMSIDELMKSGVLFGVCDMALTVFSMGVAKKMKLNADEVKKEWVAGVLPGIQVVPSGVLAVNRTQEHGCTYCFAG